MDPLIPTESREETTTVATPGTATTSPSEQVVKTSGTTGPNQAAQQTTTSTTTPTSQQVSTQRSIGASPVAAQEYGAKKTIFHAYQVVWYLLGFIEIVLAFRFVLKLLGANPDAGFSQFVYALSLPFAGPFLDLFHASATNGVETTSFFEWSTLVAAFVYVVIAWAIIKIFKLGKPTHPEEVENTVESQ